MNRVVFVLVAILFLLSVSSLTGLIRVVKAESAPIYINADGSISPSTAPIHSADNITYALTGNTTAATNGILIQRNNVVLNGAGNTMTGSGSGSGINAGINVTKQSNVTIANMTIRNFGWSIDLEYSSNCTLSGNTVTTSSRMGSIVLDFSNNDVLSGNNVTANPNDGIVLASCSNDTLSGNDLTNNDWSIYSDYSFNNILSDNTIANNTVGIYFDSSSNNTIYNNKFINNTFSQVYSSDSTNVWDNGSVGNYWSDYLTRYPNATFIDSYGVWSPPYVIDTNNTDYYPVPYVVVPEFPSFLILPLMMMATLLAVIIYKKKGAKTRSQKEPEMAYGLSDLCSLFWRRDHQEVDIERILASSRVLSAQTDNGYEETRRSGRSKKVKNGKVLRQSRINGTNQALYEHWFQQ